jgi:hypothetical protein
LQNLKFTYFLTYETVDDFKSKNPEMILTPYSSSTFNLESISGLLQVMEQILQRKFPENANELLSTIKLCLALVQGSTIHIISVKELEPINL